MKKYLVFILMFFLAFSIQLRLVNSLSPYECRNYVDGVCADEGYIVEISTQIYPENFIALIFQLVGIVTLVTILIILLQEVFKSSKKSRKRN